MRKDLQHPTDATLLQFADGELRRGGAARVRRHLDLCRECRARLRETEETLAGLIRAREWTPGMPPGPRALFRARLAALAAEERPSVWERVFRCALPATAVVLLGILALLVASSGTVSAEGPKPRTRLTPGETRPVSLREICAAASSPAQSETGADDDHDIPSETRRRVFAAYGMDAAKAPAYEVDYLITPELGGATTLRNLWPQPYSARWNARVKDRLEHRLHRLVCQGKVELATAQHDIATDWIGAYRKYVGAEVPR